MFFKEKTNLKNGSKVAMKRLSSCYGTFSILAAYKKMEKKKNRGEVVKHHWDAFALQWSTTHGVPHIAKAINERRYFRIAFWTFLLFLGLGILSWVTTLIVIRYIQFDFTTRDIMMYDECPFPAVTVCNLNPYKKSVLYKHEKVQQVMDTYIYTMQKSACSFMKDCVFERNATMDKLLEMYHFQGISDSFILQYRAQGALALELSNINVSDAVLEFDEFIKGCSYNIHPCQPSDWTTFIDPIMGRCFTFNNNSEYLANMPGPNYGLQLILEANTSETIETTEVGGFRIYIHDQGEFPFPDLYGADIPPGVESDIAIKYSQVNRLGWPYGDCSDESPEGYLYYQNYSTEGCQRSIFQAKMVSKCGCYDPYFPAPIGHNEIKVCTVEKNYDCWVNESTNRIFDPICWLPCTMRMYEDIRLSSSAWSEHPIKEIKDIEYFKENGAVIHVFFEEICYLIVEEYELYPMVWLLSDFGGQLGIWVGMSVISIIEIFILIFQVCVSLFSPKAGQNVTFGDKKNQ